MARGTITETEREFTETWENVASGTNAIIRFDSRGDTRHEVITGKRRFMVTTEERLIMEEKIVYERLNPFRNGAFRPVIVPDSVSTQSNPNAVSDDEIRSIFVSSDLAWGEWMKVIDSPETLRRMLDLADGEDTDISLRRWKTIGERLAEVKPKTRVVQKDAAEFEKIGASTGGPSGTPNAPASRRGQGGRSADYRG